MKNRTKITLVTLALAVLSSVVFLPGARSATQTNGRVLILASTVTGGASSREAAAAIAVGKAVDVVDDATWSSMTAAQFAAYDGIIIGDPTCSTTPPVAESNANVWGPVLNGNVVILGTDPTFHATYGGNAAGAQQLITSAVAFSVAASGRTGAYIALSCYYHDTSPNTPVPLLSGLSTTGFTVTGVGCYNAAHIVAASPALTGVADDNLSNWSCSVHEAFDHRPAGFIPLVIAQDPAGGPPLPGSEPFPDGTSGVPYILARGQVAPVGFVLTPFTATNPVGTTHTVTATLDQGGSPLVGVTVTFTVTGVNPTSGTGVTNSSGVATFSYLGANGGTDMIVAQYTDDASHTFTSNTVEKIWEAPQYPPAPVSPYYLTAGEQGVTLVVQLDSLINSWVQHSPAYPGQYAISVLDTVRIMGSYLDGATSTGSAYTLAGVYTGANFPFPLARASFWDGGTDGTSNYSVEYSAGGVYKFNANWGSPVMLFSTPPHYLGITVAIDNSADAAGDPLKTFWISQWDAGVVEHRRSDGTVISSFTVPFTKISCLAFDPADGTLWMGSQTTPGMFYQYSPEGTQISTRFYSALTSQNTLGGEFPMVAIGPPPPPPPGPTPTVSLAVSPTQVNEGNDALFIVTASNVSANPITIGYTLSGKAHQGSDYTTSAGQFVIPAGAVSANVAVHVILDHVRDKNETAIMTLKTGAGYKLSAFKKATLKIIDVP